MRQLDEKPSKIETWAEIEVKIACEHEKAGRTEEDEKFDPD